MDKIGGIESCLENICLYGSSVALSKNQKNYLFSLIMSLTLGLGTILRAENQKRVRDSSRSGPRVSRLYFTSNCIPCPTTLYIASCTQYNTSVNKSNKSHFVRMWPFSSNFLYSSKTYLSRTGLYLYEYNALSWDVQENRVNNNLKDLIFAFVWCKTWNHD